MHILFDTYLETNSVSGVLLFSQDKHVNIFCLFIAVHIQ